jgi:hypothetical protein
MDGMGQRVKKIEYDPKSPQERNLINMYDKEKIRSRDLRFGAFAIGGLLLIILAMVIVPWTIGKVVDLMDENEDPRLVVGSLVDQGPESQPPAYSNSRSFYVYIKNEGPGSASGVVASFTVEYFDTTTLIGKAAVTNTLEIQNNLETTVHSDRVPASAHYYIITLHLSWDDRSLTYTWTV